MEKFDVEREKLAQKIARLEMKGKIIREKERKLLTKRLIELGNLVCKASIDHLDSETLVGAFIEIKDMAQDEKIKTWKRRGKAFLEKDHEINPLPLLIRFGSELSPEIKMALRQKKFRWNQFRNEWQGFGKRDEMVELLKGHKAHVEIASLES